MCVASVLEAVLRGNATPRVEKRLSCAMCPGVGWLLGWHGWLCLETSLDYYPVSGLRSVLQDVYGFVSSCI